MSKVVAIVGDADMWCLDCFASDTRGKRQLALILAGRESRHTEDSEGNQYGAILDSSEDLYNIDAPTDKRGYYRPNACGGCHQYLVPDERQLVIHDSHSMGMVDSQGRYYAQYEVDWGIYQYNLCDVESCPECDADLSDVDDLSECPACHADLTEAFMEHCEECDKPVYQGWQCLDGGELYCSECVTVE